MRVYQLRVSIIGTPKIYIIIEASENCTFDDLHETIFHAFNRYDPHLYSFFITKKDTKNVHSIYEAPEITHPQNVEDIMGFGRKKKSTEKVSEILKIKSEVILKPDKQPLRVKARSLVCY